MAPDHDQPLQSWTCLRCGAALPAEAGTGELVTCGYCGTPFKLPTATNRCGGVNISSSSVTIGGDVVGRDKITMAASDTSQPAPTTWDNPATPGSEGVSINADKVRV